MTSARNQPRRFSIEVSHGPARHRSERVLGGAVLVMHGLEAVAAVAAAARSHVEQALGPSPELAHERLPDAELDERVDELRRGIADDERLRALCVDALAAAGVDVGSTWADRLRLRVQHPVEGTADPTSTTAAGALELHRDTWSSGILEQVNWWLPLSDVSARRTICFAPRGWSQPIANRSVEWDVTRVAEMPLIVTPVEHVEAAETVSVVCEPGDLVSFSGAQLHGSTTNHSRRTRFSLEIRSIELADREAGRRAPDLDHATPHRAWSWFRSLADGIPLEAAP